MKIRFVIPFIGIAIAAVVTALAVRPEPSVQKTTPSLAPSDPPTETESKAVALGNKIPAASDPKRWKQKYREIAPLLRIALPTRDEREDLHRKLSDPELLEEAVRLLDAPVSAYDTQGTDFVLQSIDVLRRIAADPENPLRARTIEKLREFTEAPLPGPETPLGIRRQIAGNKTETAQILLIHATDDLRKLADETQDPKLLRLINRAIEEITKLETNPT